MRHTASRWPCGSEARTNRRFLLRLLVPALALLAGAGTSPARAGVDPDRERPLPWRSEGHLLFVADVATAPGPDRRTHVDIALRIGGDQLRYLVQKDSLYGKVRLTVDFRTRFGKKERTETRTLDIAAPLRSASGWSPGHLLLDTFQVPPGLHQLRIHVEDLQTQKRGMVYTGRPEPEKGQAEGLLYIRPYPTDSLTVSEPLFAWPTSAVDSASGTAAFQRVPGGRPVLPNPDRTYGLYEGVARVYFEVHPAPAAPPAPTTVIARVLDVEGRTLALVDSAVVDEPGAWAGRLGFEVATLPAGSYDVALEVRRGGATARAKHRFNVAWRKESWERDPREFLEEAHFLLDDPDLELRYAEMTAGEQEAYLDHYWAEKDPTPLTAQNEERDKFYQRVAFANQHFGIQGVIKGMMSDRGRIFIRYGEPDEIRQQVMPAGDDNLQQVAREIALDDDPQFRNLRKPAGIGADERPFEVWTYIRVLGSESERLKGGSQNRQTRKFVFVDEQGYGNYRLMYSTE